MQCRIISSTTVLSVNIHQPTTPTTLSTMHIYILIAAAVLTVVAAQGGGGQGHHEEQHHDHHYVDYHAHPHYHFNYEVHDPKHHDFKRQWEIRDGDKVKGEYSLVQPDGKTRTVKYEADKHSGFHAQVHLEGHGHVHHQVQHHQPQQHHGGGGGI